MSQVDLHKGPWRVRAVSYVDSYLPGNYRDGRLAVQDTRTGKVSAVDLFCFPAGWRCGQIDTLPVPGYVRALARQAMGQL